MPNILIDYLAALTPEARAAFAEKAGSSPMSLRLAAHGYKTGGKLSLSPEFAARIEAASEGELPRTLLSDTCAKCLFAGGSECES